MEVSSAEEITAQETITKKERKILMEKSYSFVGESTYLLEQGEWQIDLIIDYINNPASDDEFEGEKTDYIFSTELSIDYGVTDRLQVGLSLPCENTRIVSDGISETNSGINDVSFTPSFALVRETDIFPEVAVGLEFSAPTGDEEKELGTGTWSYRPFITSSKTVTELLYVHADVSYTIIDNATDLY